MPVDQEKLTQYALGILDGAEYKMIRQEILRSTELQNELTALRVSLETIALAEKPRKPSESLRSLVLDSIQKNTRFDGFKERFARLFDIDLTTAQNLLEKINSAAPDAWQSTLLPGVTKLEFPGGPKVASATCGLVQARPGTIFPAHQHQGEERILVLQGTASDDSGKIFAVGDVFQFPPGSRHTFRIIGDETCVFAVVIFKKNKWLWFKTLLDRCSINRD